MNYHIILCTNSKKIREELEQYGFKVCVCSTFRDTIWLSTHITPDKFLYKEIHGIGYPCENECNGMCSRKCSNCSLIYDDCSPIRQNYCHIICSNLNEFIESFNKLSNYDSKRN